MAIDQDMIALIDQRIRAANSATRATGTCIRRSTTGPGADVIFDGSTVSMPVKVLGNVFVKETFRCVLEKFGSDWVVTGAWSGLGLGEASVGMNGLGNTTGGLTSNSFVDLAEIEPLIFAKAFDNTFVRMALSASTRSQGAGLTKITYGLRFTPIEGGIGYTPTDLTILSIFFTDGDKHLSGSGFYRNVDIPAGTYSVQVRWRRALGTGSGVSDANDWHSVEIDEGIQANSPIL